MRSLLVLPEEGTGGRSREPPRPDRQCKNRAPLPQPDQAVRGLAFSAGVGNCSVVSHATVPRRGQALRTSRDRKAAVGGPRSLTVAARPGRVFLPLALSSYLPSFITPMSRRYRGRWR